MSSLPKTFPPQSQSETLERRNLADALAHERNVLRTMIDLIPAYIYAKDAKSRFTAANKLVADRMGTDPDGLLGKTDFDFYPREMAEKFFSDEQALIKSGKPLVNCEEIAHDSVTGLDRVLLTSKVPLRDENGHLTGVVGIGFAMTVPADVSYSAGTVIAKSKPRTDFWRKTFYGYVTDNGHLFSIPVYGEFLFQARVNGKYAALYDQAGLMVRLDDKHWMKCGSELVEGKRWASVVFTHDFSDWSTLEDLSQSEAVYWRVARKKDSIEAQCSKDGQNYLTVRQGYFPPFVEVQVGIMCAAPEGTGFEATFDELRLDKP